MPRTARPLAGGICYHVINRGNRRARVFHDHTDYRTFLDLMQRASQRVPMRLLGYCLMPNHFHFVMWPYGDDDLSRWMHWLLTTHVRRYHWRYDTDGRIWQGRFKSIAVQRDAQLLTVLRYVQRNPVRANLVTRAEAWPWSSLSNARLCHALPFSLPGGWTEFVNEPQSSAELEAIRSSTAREVPLGTLSRQQPRAWR